MEKFGNESQRNEIRYIHGCSLRKYPTTPTEGCVIEYMNKKSLLRWPCRDQCDACINKIKPRKRINPFS